MQRNVDVLLDIKDIRVKNVQADTLEMSTTFLKVLLESVRNVLAMVMSSHVARREMEEYNVCARMGGQDPIVTTEVGT